MAERLLKDEGWSLKAEVCPVLPPHFLLSPSPVSSSALNFQVSVFPPVLWSQSPSVPWSHFSFQVSAFIPQPLFCNQQSVGSRALLSGQRPGSYQPRATPWVHRAMVILPQANGLLHKARKNIETCYRNTRWNSMNGASETDTASPAEGSRRRRMNRAFSAERVLG